MSHAPPLTTSDPSNRSWRFVIAYAAGLVGTVAVAYGLMEALELRFSQPFTFSQANRAYYYQAHVKHPDVVYLGSSRIALGVIPDVVAAELTARGAPIGRGYNLGILGGDLAIHRIVARDCLKGDRRPRLVVLGVSPFVVSEGSQHLYHAHRYGNLADILDHVRAGWMGPLDLVSDSIRGVENLMQFPLRGVMKPDPRHRDKHLAQSHGGWWLPQEAEHAPAPGPAPFQQAPVDKFRFDDHTRPALALKQIQTLTRDRKMRLVVVQCPRHPQDPAGAAGAGVLDRYRQWIETFCRRRSIEYHGCDEQPSFKLDDFHDLNHLNAKGATTFSRWIAAVVAPLVERGHGGGRGGNN